MKFTCLSEGRGYHFPPCHILNICGFRILIDCPIDLSALAIFSPNPIDEFYAESSNESASHSSDDSLDAVSKTQKRQRIEKELNPRDLIQSEPWYKTVTNLSMWNPSFIDIVLISSPMGMLGLPYLIRGKDFSAKIYATEAATRIGELMMKDLIAMHMEFRQFYGPEKSGFPPWMNWEKVEKLPLLLKDIALGKDGSKLGGWMPLYSAADVKDTVKIINTVKYGEEVCYNGALIIKAFSSGLEIGSCNWTINGPKRKVAYISSSIFESSTAMQFDYHNLQNSGLVIYSDFSSWKTTENSCPALAVCDFSNLGETDENMETSSKSLIDIDEKVEEMEKIDFICTCSIDSVRTGGSVLIPIGRLGIILQLLEQIASSLKSANLEVPIFIISSVAEELMSYLNIIPEWLCKDRQEKLYSGNPLFAHLDLIKDKRLHLFPAVHSVELLKIWQEPCIVFCPHWNFRLGPVVHLLRRWCSNPNALLIMEESEDVELMLLPFKPMEMKVLQCSFLSGIKLHKLQPLVKILQPKLVLFPKISVRHIFSPDNSIQLIYFTENETIRIPSLEKCSEIDITAEVATQLSWTKLEKGKTNIARLKGDLLIEFGKHRLVPQRNKVSNNSNSKLSLYWGTLNSDNLLTELMKMGLKVCTLKNNEDNELEKTLFLNISEPSEALIEIDEKNTVVYTDDENLAMVICEAISRILSGI